MGLLVRTYLQKVPVVRRILVVQILLGFQRILDLVVAVLQIQNQHRSVGEQRWLRQLGLGLELIQILILVELG
jgi:hypothetical protein